jgi:hypothetical protein
VRKAATVTRAQPAAAPVVRTAPPSRPQLMSAIRVSSPTDAAEHEASSVAARVVSAPAPAFHSPYVSRFAGAVQAARSAAKPAAPAVGPGTAARITSLLGTGQPLPNDVKNFMEPRFGADFSGVRIHTSESSAKLNNELSAQAFTVGNDVFFSRGAYQPQSREGRELIAHELTHTIQQGAAPQRAADSPVAMRVDRQVQRLGISDALDYFADKANYIPGFRMFTIILGVNPINMAPVSRSAGNVLRAIIEFIPGGALLTEAMANHGVFDKAGAWVEQQISSLGMTGRMFKDALSQFIDSLSWRDIFHLGDVWDRAKRIFTAPIDRLLSFIKGLAVGILNLIKDAILRPLAKLAEGTRGYDLLKAVLGKDPITGDPVPRTAETLIGGFMKLIGQEDVWENMKKANAVARCFAWFQSALNALMGFVSQIPQLAIQAFKSLEVADVILVPRALLKVARVFGDFVVKFMTWAGNAVWNLLEIIFDAVSPGAWGYIKKTGAALKSILKNPLPFVGNLVKAAKLGFTNFLGRFLTHLKTGLLDWLTGSLPGVYIPKAFELREIVMFALSVLGLTWANIRQKLVKVVGEPVVVALEKGFDIVVTLVRDGPAAAWDKIREQLGSLKDMVISGIMDMVVTTVVQKAVPKLIAMFIPGAGFISAIISIYDTVMVFVNKIKQIIAVVKSFVDSIVAIAGGAIGAAAQRVEAALAGGLSLAINFLAGFIGLGKVADKVMGVIQKIRAPIDKALDWLINFIVNTAKKVFAKAFGSPKPGAVADERTPEMKQAAVHAAATEASALLTAPGAMPQTVAARLPELKTRHRLTSIALEQTGPNEYDVVVEINPREKTPKKQFDASELKKDQPVQALSPSRPGSSQLSWAAGVVVTVDLQAKRFRWTSVSQKSARTAVLDFADQGKKWRLGHVMQLDPDMEQVEADNQLEAWPSFDRAKHVLNFRYNGYPKINPPGLQWEHIIEQAHGSINTVENLALASAILNNKLGKRFEEPYASHEAPSGLTGTNGVELRAFLAGKPLDVHRRWKLHVYSKLGATLSWKSSERGKWQELR